MSDMDPAQDDLNMSRAHESFDLGDELSKRPGPALAAHARDDAEGAGHVAAVLNLQEGSRVSGELRDPCGDAQLFGIDLFAKVAEKIGRALGFTIAQDPVDRGELAQYLGYRAAMVASVLRSGGVGLRAASADPFDWNDSARVVPPWASRAPPASARAEVSERCVCRRMDACMWFRT